MRAYRFSLGDTRTGCLGFCFTVSAGTRRDALNKARRALETIEEVAIDLSDTGATDGRLYFNARNLHMSDIADVSEQDK
jgi:hypothetical protein